MENKGVLKILSWLIFLTFDLMLLGAAVRTFDAGLACPDWPLCFGRVIPDVGHLGVFLEFSHRVVAGVVLILYVLLVVRVSRLPYKSSGTYFGLLAGGLLLLAQVLMGALTVLKLLDSGIVTMHLGLATLFFATLIYLKKKLMYPPFLSHTSSYSRSYYLLYLPVAVVFGQILLGGWVASTYSGLVCVDFPTCHGQWFPTFSGSIGAQVIHRLGAYFTVLTIVGLTLYFFFKRQKLILSGSTLNPLMTASALVCLQLILGILNIKLLVPSWLTIIHLAVALVLFKVCLKLAFQAGILLNSSK